MDNIKISRCKVFTSYSDPFRRIGEDTDIRFLTLYADVHAPYWGDVSVVAYFVVRISPWESFRYTIYKIEILQYLSEGSHVIDVTENPFWQTFINRIVYAIDYDEEEDEYEIQQTAQ